jgi:hypothetical protein
MRMLLAITTALVTALGTGLLVLGIRQQIAWADCGAGGGCVEPSSWPVTLGILVLVGGLFFVVWAAASRYSSRVLHPSRDALEERERLQRVGVPGRATVLRAEEAGTGSTGEMLVDVQLAVDVDGQPSYEVSHRTAVPRLHGRRLRVGRSLPVFVDPENKGQIVVDWSLLPSRSRPAQGGPNGTTHGG